MTEPERKAYVGVSGHYWTCPPGWKYPRCGGCGHNFNDSRPVPEDTPPTTETCHWCQAEEQGTLNTDDYIPYDL